MLPGDVHVAKASLQPAALKHGYAARRLIGQIHRLDSALRRMTRRQRTAAVIPVAAKPMITPDNPAEALDRISIPADTMGKINEMLTAGGSIIVSDQGINQGETGEGTDFIVRLR